MFPNSQNVGECCLSGRFSPSLSLPVLDPSPASAAVGGGLLSNSVGVSRQRPNLQPVPSSSSIPLNDLHHNEATIGTLGHMVFDYRSRLMQTHCLDASDERTKTMGAGRSGQTYCAVPNHHRHFYGIGNLTS
jgi:hypothetical protein